MSISAIGSKCLAASTFKGGALTHAPDDFAADVAHACLPLCSVGFAPIFCQLSKIRVVRDEAQIVKDSAVDFSN